MFTVDSTRFAFHFEPFCIPFCSQDTGTHSPVIVKKLATGGIYRSLLSLGLLTGDSGIGHLMQRVFVSLLADRDVWCLQDQLLARCPEKTLSRTHFSRSKFAPALGWPKPVSPKLPSPRDWGSPYSHSVSGHYSESTESPEEFHLPIVQTQASLRSDRMVRKRQQPGFLRAAGVSVAARTVHGDMQR